MGLFVSDKRNGCDEHETTGPAKNCIDPGKCLEGKAGDVEEPVPFCARRRATESG